jgi:hypothetical protein
LCNIGDFNSDGVPDLAVSAVSAGGGGGKIYFLYLQPTGIVLNYTSFGPSSNGGPELPVFSGFGTAIYLLPDLNNDTVPELAVGAPFLYEAGSLNIQAGEVFVCFMLRNGSVNGTSRISETSGRELRGSVEGVMPAVVSI